MRYSLTCVFLFGLYGCSHSEENSLVATPSVRIASPTTEPTLTCEESKPFQLQWGTANDDWATGLVLDQKRNLYVVGYQNGTEVNDFVTLQGDADAWVSKFRPTGQLMWQKTFDTGGTDSAESIILDERTQDIYVLGRTTGAFPGFSNHGSFDIFLAQMDEHEGQVKKVLQFGDEKPQHPHSLQIDQQNHLWIGGYNDTYVIGNAVQSLDKAFVARINQSLLGDDNDFLQVVFPNPLAWSWGHGIATNADPQQGVYLVGEDGLGGFISKTDASTSILWTRHFGTPLFAWAFAAKISLSDELWVIGSMIPPKGGYGDLDAFWEVLDPQTGNINHLFLVGTNHWDAATAMAVDQKGNVYIAGFSKGTFLTGGRVFAPEEEGVNLFVAQFDQEGKPTRVWQKESLAPSFVSALVVDECGQISFVGYTKADLVGEHSHLGNQDAFLIRLSPEDFSDFDPTFAKK